MTPIITGPRNGEQATPLLFSCDFVSFVVLSSPGPFAVPGASPIRGGAAAGSSGVAHRPCHGHIQAIDGVEIRRVEGRDRRGALVRVERPDRLGTDGLVQRPGEGG